MKVFLIILSLLPFCTNAQKLITEKPSQFSLDGRTVTVFTSSDSAGYKLAQTNSLKFIDLKQPVETQICVFVNPGKTFQTFVGIGGAITDASAEVFAKLSKEKQQEFLNAYYSSDKGIGYSIIRTNMNSCDFSSYSYTYVKEGDTALKTFNIAKDKEYKLPLIQQAMKVAGKGTKLFISPWSPPAFMKSNNNMLRGGKLLPAFYQSWANYYVKFIDSYQKEGVPVWGLTIQNEPMATQTWESCIYTAEEERDFLKNYLGPTLAKAKLSDKNIIIWDHNRDLISQRTSVMLSDAKAAKYVWGIGFHWYEDWSGGDPMFENIKKVNEMFPEKKLFFTEGCADSYVPDSYQNWANGEKYGRSMINDFNNGTVGWTDWNVLLDEKGGPNHVGNYCFAPVHANTVTGELIYTPSYYYIGHFSKFIDRGAKRISSVASRSQLLTTSFINPNGKISTIVMNSSAKHVSYFLCVGTKAVAIDIPPHAIQTMVY